MEHRPLGRTGLNVSVLGFGGAEIGASEVSQETVERLLNTALDAGLNTIDTAECYGESEVKIGKAISKRRDEFILFTKMGHDGEALGGSDWSPEVLRKSIDRSLQRLQVDHVDLLQIHSCGKDLLEKGEVIEILQEAKAAGKTRHIGYSGDNEAADYAVSLGVFETLQTSINVADQLGLDRWVKAAHEAGLGIIAKRPIANAAWRRGDDEKFYGEVYRDRLKELDYPFLRTEDDIADAMRFTLAVPGVSTLIAGTNKPERWPQNAALADRGSIDPEQYKNIRERWAERAKLDWNGQT